MPSARPFTPNNSRLHRLIERFLASVSGCSRVPTFPSALPFHEGSGRNWFPHNPPAFPPYGTQEKAFDRLLPGTPRNTLVPTAPLRQNECFLLPDLEHCRQRTARAAKGIRRSSSTDECPGHDQGPAASPISSHSIPSWPSCAPGSTSGLPDVKAPPRRDRHPGAFTGQNALHKAPPDIPAHQLQSKLD